VKKFNLVIFLFFALQVSAQKPKNFIVDVTVKEQPIHDLFTQIEEQLALKFSYNTRLINADSVITYSGLKTVKKVVFDIFDKRIQAKMVGNYLVLLDGKKAIKASNKAHPNIISFTGVIRNKETSKPIPNASIYEISSRQTVLSNSSGEFKLVLEKGDAKNFSVAKINYTDTLISVNLKEKNSVIIYLNPIIKPMTFSTSSSEKAILKDSNTFIKKMVPKEGQLASVNLMAIDEVNLWQVSVIPTVGTNMKASGIVTNRMSFNLFGGYNGGVNGVEVGGLLNILTRDMKGFQVAGLTNQVQGTTYGFQMAGIHNRAEKKLIGLQMAGISNFLHAGILGMQVSGISNIVNGTFGGFQVAGIQNHVTKNFKGFQLAGTWNWAEDSLIGFQVAGIANIIRSSVSGFQLSGIHNLSIKDVNGVQLSGFYNHTSGTLKGAQISITNYAKTNNGLQIGLINIADSANGIAIGLFNFVRNGYHPLEVFGNEVLYTNIAFKSGVDAFYTTWSVGLRPSNPEVFGIGFGIGSRINTWKWLSISIDLSFTAINEKEITNGYIWELNVLNRADITLDFNIGRFTAFAGPALNYHVSQMGYNETGVFNTDIAIDPFYTQVYGQTQVQSWWGGKAGLRYDF
jgi:hypothetical protein